MNPSTDANRPGARRAPPRAVYYVLMLVLVPVVTLLVGELVVRATGIGSPNQRVLFNSVLLKGKPDAEYVNTKENVNTVRLNNWGFHDRDRQSTTPSYRVVVFGDSMVEALQVPAASTFTALLDTRFERDRASVEVVNAGASGVGTGYQYLLWREFFDGSKKVDHVVLALFMGNDLEDNSRVLGSTPTNFGVYVTPGGDIDINRVEFSAIQRVVRSLTDRSALVNTLYTRLYLIKRQFLAERRARERHDAPAGVQPPAVRPLDNRAWDATIDGTLRIIERWAAEIRDKHVAFSIALLHAPEESTGGHYRHPRKQQFVDRLRSAAPVAQIPLLELSFDDVDPISIYSFDGQTIGHFNYEGHRAAADRVYPWLRALVDEDRRHGSSPNAKIE